MTTPSQRVSARQETIPNTSLSAFHEYTATIAPVDALLICAMPEEMMPLMSALTENGFTLAHIPAPYAREIGSHETVLSFTTDTANGATSQCLTLRAGSVFSAGNDAGLHLALCITGIGMVDTAQALGLLISSLTPTQVISVGSAGGLSRDSRVGNVVVGETYINGGADATVFDYLPGQVPQHPAVFEGDSALIECAQQVAAMPQFAGKVRFGQVLSSDSFITERNVGNYREVFPAALSTDMESTSAAQVCASWGVPFMSCRAISDLCGDPDDQSVSFHAELDTVAHTAATFALECLRLSELMRFPAGSRVKTS